MDNTKVVVFIIDGAADIKSDKFPRTPLEVAGMPNVKKLLENSILGTTNNTPSDFPPGSDVAIMSIMGYSPYQHYSGRGAIEAVAQGIPLKSGDYVARCNLVFVSDFPSGEMIDYSAGHIRTELAKEIVEALSKYLNEKMSGKVSLYPGISYRHILVVHDFSGSPQFTPPHDITGKNINNFLPSGEGNEVFRTVMELAREFLKKHFPEVFEGRHQHGKANLVWCWGGGTVKKLPEFREVFGRTLAVITAVDLVRGLAILSGGEVVDVPGATGFIDTNFEGKAENAVRALNKFDVVIVHYEAPDEMGHLGDFEGKVKALELFDERLLGNFLKIAEERHLLKSIQILILPDHPTPVEVKTHVHSFVPFMLWKGELDLARLQRTRPEGFTEETARKYGVKIEKGHLLLPLIL